MSKNQVGGIIAAAALLLPALSYGQVIDANLSDDVVEAQFKNPMGLNNFNNSLLQLGFLYKDDKQNSTMGNLGLEVSGPAGGNAAGLELGAGINGYIASVKEYDVGAITLGLMLRYAPPVANRFAITGRFNYAPDITTFNDGENFMVTNIRFGYEILPKVEIYTGYRNIEVELQNRDDSTSIDDGWNIGLEIGF